MTTSNRRRRIVSKTSPDTQAQIESVKREFSQLEQQAELTDVHETIGHINGRLAEYPADLKDLERRGFQHSRPLRERLGMLQDQWKKVEPKVNSSLRSHKTRLRSGVRSTSRLVNQATSGRKASLSSAESSLESLERKIDSAESELRSHYAHIDSELYQVHSELRRIEWMMAALEESPEIKLGNNEGPLMAVESEWQRDGDEGPKGVLFLTDQRILFEQKEEIVTKKRFGVFKSESEMVHKLWLDINATDIDSVKDSEEGGFLGIGKADILELTCTGEAPISRAKFHLKGQESSDWQAQIKHLQSGDLAADRHQQAQAVPILKFPSNCPNCMASLPQAHRGATQVKCDYCGSLVNPD